MKPAETAALRRAVKTHAPVYVEWLDSMGYRGGWIGADDLKDHLPTIRSTGFVMRLNDVKVSLAGSYDPENDTVNDVIDIPLFAIGRVLGLT